MIGDSLTSDIKGGIQAGLATCWYKRPGVCNGTSWQPDYEIESLYDICKILEEKIMYIQAIIVHTPFTPKDME